MDVSFYTILNFPIEPTRDDFEAEIYYILSKLISAQTQMNNFRKLCTGVRRWRCVDNQDLDHTQDNGTQIQGFNLS